MHIVWTAATIFLFVSQKQNERMEKTNIVYTELQTRNDWQKQKKKQLASVQPVRRGKESIYGVALVLHFVVQLKIPIRNLFIFSSAFLIIHNSNNVTN